MRKKKRKPNGYWTKERCHEEALKYNLRSDFGAKSRVAYTISHKKGWIDDICSHMISLSKPKGYWTKERCQEIALKCNIRKELASYEKGAYKAAMKNGWLDDIFKHLKPYGNRYFRCVYVYEFPDNSAYVGLTHNINERHKNRMKNDKDTVKIHIDKTELEPKRKQLTEYIDVEEAQKMEGVYLKQYKENGWNILNKAKTGGIGGNDYIWTYDKCKEEAQKYSIKKEFRESSRSAYNAIVKYGWLDDLCSHMQQNQYPKNYWTYDKCKKEALKYSNRTTFMNNVQSAYSFATKNNLLNEICSHMVTKPRNYWTYNKCKEKAQKYKSKKMFRINENSAYVSSRKNGWLFDFF